MRRFGYPENQIEEVRALLMAEQQAAASYPPTPKGGFFDAP